MSSLNNDNLCSKYIEKLQAWRASELNCKHILLGMGGAK